MRKYLGVLLFLITWSGVAQVITNVSRLKINQIKEGIEAGKVLIIDAENEVKWVHESEIIPDLSGYYTKVDVDAILLDYYTKNEVDGLLDDIDLSDYLTKTEAVGLYEPKFNKNTAFNKNFGAGNNDVARGSELANKQDKLTAGSGIEIDNNEIDLTGSIKDDVAKGVDAENKYQVVIGGRNNTAYFFKRQNPTIKSEVDDYGLLALVPRLKAGNYGVYGVSVGWQAHAEGHGSVALGMDSHSEKPNSTALGRGAHTGGQGSLALGLLSYAERDISSALGREAHAEGESSVALGWKSHAQSYMETNIGMHPTLYQGNLTGWNNNDRIFNVALSISTNNRKDAFTILKSGKATLPNHTIAHAKSEDKAIITKEALLDIGDSRWLETSLDVTDFVRTSGVQNIADTKTFLDSPIVPNPTLENHAVNKKYVDEVITAEREFELVETGSNYSAIIVREFDNLINGMTYGEGAIDFGITLGNTHKMGVYSFKQGRNTAASGNYSSAFGNGTTASGNYSSAFGGSTTASGNYSSAFGDVTTASGGFSSAFGSGTVANEFASLAIGRFSTDGAEQYGWANGAPIFKVGNGTSISNRKNAYTLYNDGRSEQEKSFEITTASQGIILKSPNGTRFLITVENDGTLKTTQQ